VPSRQQRATCEGYHSLDVRQLHRKDVLRPGLRFVWWWTRNNEPTGSITIEIEQDAIVLMYRVTNGFRSEWGAKVYAHLCSVVATGRRPHRTGRHPRRSRSPRAQAPGLRPWEV
jgi:hypothetical protein